MKVEGARLKKDEGVELKGEGKAGAEVRRRLDGCPQGAVSLLRVLVNDEPHGLDEWLAANRLDAPLATWLAAHGLAPFVFYRFSEARLVGQLPAQARSALRAEYLQIAAHNLLAIQEAAAWATRFASQGITAIWLKGVPLSQTVYPAPGLRPMGDIDLLVPRHELPAALALAEATTGQAAATLAEDAGMHAVFQLGPGGFVKMEIHWSLLDIPGGQGVGDVAWFLKQQQAIAIDGIESLTLRPEAHLLYLCAHAEIAHGERQFRLLRYLDLHWLIVRTPGFDWKVVIDYAVTFGWTYAVERALSIAERWFATPLPDYLLDTLRARRPAHEDISLVTRRQMPANRWGTTLDRFAAMRWSQRLRVAQQLAFPPPAYMRWRYHIRNGWKLPLYYFYRWWDVTREMLRSQEQHPGEDRLRGAPRSE